MELFLDNTGNSFLVELFSHYSQLVSRKKVNLIALSEVARSYITSGAIKLPALPALLSPKEILSDPLSICVYLANISYTSEILLGVGNDVQFLQVLDVSRRIQKNSEGVLKHFNRELESKVFLVGASVTLADLILFSFVYPYVTIFDDSTKWSYNNLFRWYNNIQHLDGIEQFLTSTGRAIASYPEVTVEGAAAKGKATKKK